MRKLGSNANELEEVVRVTLDLVEVLGLVEETDKSSLRVFVDWAFNEIDIEAANIIVHNAICIDNYIQLKAESVFETLGDKFPNRSYWEVIEKLKRVESIRVTVAIIKLANEIEDLQKYLWKLSGEALEDYGIYPMVRYNAIACCIACYTKNN